MAREKGMGNLQQEKSGRWTARVGIRGHRISRSTGTKDRAKAERFLERLLAPLGLGKNRLALRDVWYQYVVSPKRRDISESTLNMKKIVWNHFASWIEERHLEVTELSHVNSEVVAEYLAWLRHDHTASTYNNRVCILRDVFRVLAEKAGLVENPWDEIKLRTDDSHSRRALSVDELRRLQLAAEQVGENWRRLLTIGLYTGLRLGDCCQLEWASVDLERGIVQLIPAKTRAHAHGQPITIPLHPVLSESLSRIPLDKRAGYVIPELADLYQNKKWLLCSGLQRVFHAAGIQMSIAIKGRRRLAPEATFHSLRHTFVSMAANAGVPLAIIQSIVGHSSTAMTRHYYHESEAALRQAISAIPRL